MGESHYNKVKMKIDFIPSNEDLLDVLESDELNKIICRFATASSHSTRRHEDGL